MTQTHLPRFWSVFLMIVVAVGCKPRSESNDTESIAPTNSTPQSQLAKLSPKEHAERLLAPGYSLFLRHGPQVSSGATLYRDSETTNQNAPLAQIEKLSTSTSPVWQLAEKDSGRCLAQARALRPGTLTISECEDVEQIICVVSVTNSDRAKSAPTIWFKDTHEGYLANAFMDKNMHVFERKANANGDHDSSASSIRIASGQLQAKNPGIKNDTSDRAWDIDIFHADFLDIRAIPYAFMLAQQKSI